MSGGEKTSKFQNRNELVALAEERGLVAFFREPNELFLDWDIVYSDEVAYAQPDTVRTLNNNDVTIKGWFPTRSNTGHIHIYIKLDCVVDPPQALVFQSALGSDPTKEMLGSFRLREDPNAGNHSVLFETQDQAQRVVLWRSAMESLFGDRRVKDLADRAEKAQRKLDKELENVFANIIPTPGAFAEDHRIFRRRKMTKEEKEKIREHFGITKPTKSSLIVSGGF